MIIFVTPRKWSSCGYMEQLLLFQESPVEKLQREMQLVKESCNKSRKGQFAKIGSLTKEIQDLRADLEILKRGVCQQRISLVPTSDSLMEMCG